MKLINQDAKIMKNIDISMAGELFCDFTWALLCQLNAVKD